MVDACERRSVNSPDAEGVSLATLVRRLFPADVVDSVLELLALYGDGLHEAECERVQRAIVALSEGDVDRLLHFLQAAQQDDRDVLHWAQDAAARRDGQPSLELLRREWSWVLPEPLGIVAWNAFGNALVETVDGSVWRVCPEDLSAEFVAPRADLDARFADPEFAADWFVEPWVQMARQAVGPVGKGECYGFKVWPILAGGDGYTADNLAIKTRLEWLAASGAVGRQVQALPDGASIELKVLGAGERLVVR